MPIGHTGETNRNLVLINMLHIDVKTEEKQNNIKNIWQAFH